jgi:hypothetical protein
MNLDELDQLVENYLRFRKFGKSVEALAAERQEAKNIKELENRDDVIDRIMKSLEKCDSLRLLTLWDTYVIQVLDEHPAETVAEARVAEFYVHLYCATYPFRGEVLETVNTPDVAARYAARSMTIFKRFLELRGRLLLKMPEFSGIKSLHKIAFPPTHPSYSYLFRPEWVTSTKERIRKFLTEFFMPPKLYNDMITVQNMGMMEAREEEIKRLFQQREEKLLEFSRSIYDISHDLILTLDEGKTVDKEFLCQFKLKFEEFRTVLEPGSGGGGGESKLSEAKEGGGGQVVRKRRRKKKKHRDHKSDQAPLITDLSYTVIVQDIQAMVGEVEVELNSLAKHDRRMTSIDAEVALQSAMQASAIFNSLNDFLTAKSDPSASKEVVKDNRRNAALVLIDNDVFLLKEQQCGESSAVTSYPHSIMKAFRDSFDSLSTYAARLTVGSPKEKTFCTGDIGSTYGILYSASCATVYNMCKLFGGMVSCLSASEFSAEMKEHSGFNSHQFFTSLCEALFRFPVASDNTSENLKIIFLALIAMFSQEKKHKRQLVKKGYLDWISKTLEECSDSAMTDILSNDVYVLCLLLTSSILEDPEAERGVVASLSMKKACLSILRVIAKNLVKEADIEESLHIICLRIICHLLKEKSIRDEFLTEMEEVVTPLRTRVQANLSLNPAAEAFHLSNKIMKFTNTNAEIDVQPDDESSDECVDSVSLAEEYFSKLLLNMPDEANTVDYKNQNPKESGVKLLINYTKSYIAEHGSLYDETTSIGEF